MLQSFEEMYGLLLEEGNIDADDCFVEMLYGRYNIEIQVDSTWEWLKPILHVSNARLNWWALG